MKNVTLKVLVLALSVFFIGNVNGQDMIDLTGIDNPNILTDTLPDIPSGAVVLLEPGKVYNAGYAFDKSVIIKSSDPSNEQMPQIDCTSNFNFADGANVDSIIFINIEFFGEYDSRYVLNSNVAATVGELRFDGCKIHDLRGILRMKDAGPGSLETYTINNCVITMIRDYAILTVDRDDWIVNHIMIKNSTISKVRSFLVSKNNSTSVVIDGCTMNEVTSSGREMFRWRTSGQDNVTEGITIKNTIWGSGWDEEGGGTAIDGFAGLGETTWTVENTYATNELNFTEEKDTIFALLENVYDGSASDLWTYPSEGEFFFLDTEFAGIGTAGDPRWAPEESPWMMYTADSLPDASTPSFSASNTSGDQVAENTIEEDVDNSGNSLLKLSAPGDNSKHMWKYTFENDPQEALTLVARVKGTSSEINRTMEFDLDFGGFRERLYVNNDTTFELKESGLKGDLPADPMGWHIYRLTKSGDQLTFYFDENPIAVATVTTTSTSSNNYFRFGDGNGGTTLEGLVDWVIWDESGVYAPGEGTAIPASLIQDITTGVPVYGAKLNVNVYPNPATNKVYIDFNQPIQVAIYNIAGSMVKSKFIQSKFDYVNISDLQPGVYLIRSQNDNTFAKKLIKR